MVICIGEVLNRSRFGEFRKYRVGDYRLIRKIEDGRLIVAGLPRQTPARVDFQTCTHVWNTRLYPRYALDRRMPYCFKSELSIVSASVSL